MITWGARAPINSAIPFHYSHAGQNGVIPERARWWTRPRPTGSAWSSGPMGVWMTKEVAWSQLEVGSLQAGIDLENRTQITSTGHASPFRPPRRHPRRSPMTQGCFRRRALDSG